MTVVFIALIGLAFVLGLWTGNHRSQPTKPFVVVWVKHRREPLPETKQP